MSKVHAALAAVFMLAGSLFAAGLDADTQSFLTNTYNKNQHEIAMGKMAADRASSQDVKQFGQHLVDDHTAMGKELQDLAGRLNFDLMKGADLHKQHADKFETLTGIAWDRAFMNWAIEGHMKGVEAFDTQHRTGKNADVAAFAAKHLPTLKHHLQMAKDVNARISKGAMASPPATERATDVSYEAEDRSSIRERESFVSYDRPVHRRYVSYDDDCEACEVKCERVAYCDNCEETTFETTVYDNDYRALQVDYKDGDTDGAR